MRIALDALKGHSLNVERSGSGPNTIIAIHGFTGSAATWDPFVGAAGNDYSLMLPELQGHGKSDAPEDPELYDMKHTIMALAEIADRLEVRKAHWLGYSLGGRVALAAAISLTDRTLSLTIESGSAGLDNIEEKTNRIRSDAALADKIEHAGIPGFVDYWESLPLWSGQSRLPSSVREKIRTERLANNSLGLSNSLRGIGVGAQPSFHKELFGLSIPSLFVAGEEDAKFSEIARRMHRTVSESKLCLMAESGHAVHLEQPEFFNRAVLDFLSAVDCPLNTLQTQPGSQPNR